MRKVTFAAFTEALTAPGAFGGELFLSDKKQVGIEMWEGAGKLHIDYKGMEVIVPWANVKNYVLYPEEKSSLKQH